MTSRSAAAVAKRVDEEFQRSRRETRRLPRSERTEHERADDEGKNGGRVLFGETVPRTLLNHGDLAVDQPSQPREQRRIAQRLREDADPAPRGDEIRRTI